VYVINESRPHVMEEAGYSLYCTAVPIMYMYLYNPDSPID